MAHPLCLAHLSLLELAPPQLVEVCADAGFTQVSVRIAPAFAGDARPALLTGSPLMRETLARLRDRGVAVHDVELIRLGADTDVRDLEPFLAAATELGASQVLVAGESGDETALAERFHALCELGAGYRLAMGLEFMPWRGIRSLDAARRVVTSAGVGGIVVDAIHLDRAGHSPAELVALPASLLAWFQICDAPAERPASPEELLFQARSARLPPGDGGLDLAAMLRALPPTAVVSIEVPLHGEAGRLPPLQRARLLRERTLALLERTA